MRNAFKETQVIAASAARTAATSWTFDSGCRGGFVVINVTAKGAAPSVTFTWSGVDPASGALWTILASAAITNTGTTVLRVHPSLTASANSIANDILPQNMKIAAAVGNSDSLTYSISFVGVN